MTQDQPETFESYRQEWRAAHQRDCIACLRKRGGRASSIDLAEDVGLRPRSLSQVLRGCPLLRTELARAPQREGKRARDVIHFILISEVTNDQ